MNRELTNDRLMPKKVVTVYADKHNRNFYLEQREVTVIGDAYELLAPMPVSDDTFMELGRNYMKAQSVEMEFQGFIGTHMLYGSNKPGKTVVMWYRPAMQRSLNFSSALQIKGSKMVHVPATLYVAVNKQLHVYALLNDERPTAATKIFSAPFFNIYVDGNVCMGTAYLGQRTKSFEGEAARFERGFYMAEQNGGQSANACKTPLSKLWNALIKSGKPFPSKDELVQHKKFKTVGQLMKFITGKDFEYDEE